MSGQDSFYAELAKRAEKERKSTTNTDISTSSVGVSGGVKHCIGGDGTQVAQGVAETSGNAEGSRGTTKRKRGGDSVDDPSGGGQPQQQQQQQPQQPQPEKKRRVMTQEALDRLAQARQKGLLVRQQKAAARRLGADAKTPPSAPVENNPPAAPPDEDSDEAPSPLPPAPPQPKKRVAFSVPQGMEGRDANHVYMPVDAFKTLVQGFALSGRHGGGGGTNSAPPSVAPPQRVFSEPVVQREAASQPPSVDRRAIAESSRKARLNSLCFGS
jgi:hypothetical protein